MTQVFQIFRKDFRQLWIELSVSAATLGLLTWSEWWLCTPAGNPRWYNNVLPFVLLIVSWWVVVVRLIHIDPLVGDRQFWITRPYVWYKLLAAKALFLFSCLGIPLAISQVILLAASHQPLLSNLGRVIADICGALVAGVLPVAALAAILGVSASGSCAQSW